MFIVEFLFQRILQLILGFGRGKATLFDVDEEKRTPIHLTAMNGHFDTAQLILGIGDGLQPDGKVLDCLDLKILAHRLLCNLFAIRSLYAFYQKLQLQRRRGRLGTFLFKNMFLSAVFVSQKNLFQVKHS